MAFELQDGAGGTKKARVSNNNELYVLSNSRTLQHSTSHEFGRSFQISTFLTSITNQQNNLLIVKNLSQTYDIIIMTLIAQHIGLTGGTALPSINSYFSLWKGPVRNSGGEIVSAENTNFSSANISNISAYKNGFVTSSDGVELDRRYLKDNGELLYQDKFGSTVIGPNDSIGISLTTDHTSGYAMTTIYYLELEAE